MLSLLRVLVVNENNNNNNSDNNSPGVSKWSSGQILFTERSDIPLLWPCVRLATTHNWYAGMYLGFGMQHRHSERCLYTGAPPKPEHTWPLLLLLRLPAYDGLCAHIESDHADHQYTHCDTAWEGSPGRWCGLSALRPVMVRFTSWTNTLIITFPRILWCDYPRLKSIPQISMHCSHPLDAAHRQLGSHFAVPFFPSPWLAGMNQPPQLAANQ